MNNETALGHTPEDKTYWLRRWYERRFLNKMWEIYPDSGLSWNDIMVYVRSGRMESDIWADISQIVVECEQ